MARKKVKLAWITNGSSRKATYRARKKGLMKKVNELSTLRGVEACAVVYKDISDPQPDQVWPTELDQAHKTLAKFKGLPDMGQSRSMLNLEGIILEQRSHKLREELIKQLKDNREMELTHLMYQNLVGTHGLNHDVGAQESRDLIWLIDRKTKEILSFTKRLHHQSAIHIPNQNDVAADGDVQRRMIMMNGDCDNQQIGSTSSAAAAVSAAAAAAAHDHQG